MAHLISLSYTYALTDVEEPVDLLNDVPAKLDSTSTNSHHHHHHHRRNTNTNQSTISIDSSIESNPSPFLLTSRSLNRRHRQKQQQQQRQRQRRRRQSSSCSSTFNFPLPPSTIPKLTTATATATVVSPSLYTVLNQQQQRYEEMQKRERERDERLAAIRKQRFEREREFELLRDLQRQELLDRSMSSFNESDQSNLSRNTMISSKSSRNTKHWSWQSMKKRHRFSLLSNYSRKHLSVTLRALNGRSPTSATSSSPQPALSSSSSASSASALLLTNSKSRNNSLTPSDTASIHSNGSSNGAKHRNKHVYVALPKLQAEPEDLPVPLTYTCDLSQISTGSNVTGQARSSSDTYSYMKSFPSPPTQPPPPPPPLPASLPPPLPVSVSIPAKSHVSWRPTSIVFKSNYSENSVVHAYSYFSDNDHDQQQSTTTNTTTNHNHNNDSMLQVLTPTAPLSPNDTTTTTTTIATTTAQRVKFANPIHVAISHRMPAGESCDQPINKVLASSQQQSSTSNANTTITSDSDRSSTTLRKQPRVLNMGYDEFLQIESPSSPNTTFSFRKSFIRREKTSRRNPIDSERDIAEKALNAVDDPGLPCLTFRFWLISMIYVVLAAACSQLFYFRANFLVFSSFFVQFTAYPLGRILEAILPRHEYFLGGYSFCLNPGPFNRKEHMLIGAAVNAGGMAAYASDVIAAQELFFGIRTSGTVNLFLIITTQFIGFGLAGYLREFLVLPAAMIWPTQLAQYTLFNALHNSRDSDVIGGGGGHSREHSGTALLTPRSNSSSSLLTRSGATSSSRTSSRQRVFMIVLVVAFAYHLLPLTVMPVLTSISIVCLLMPRNGFAQLLGSGMQGMGMGTISLDWAAIGSVAPMYTPWWAQVNFFLGAILVLWVIAPLLWCFNVWYARVHPIVSADLYDEESRPFSLSRILLNNFSLDPRKLENYSQLRMSPVFAISFGAMLFALAATCTHVILYYGKDILRQLRASWTDHGKYHKYRQTKYRSVHWLVYFMLFAFSFGGALVVSQFHLVPLPWWALFLSLSIAAMMALPIGIIQAVTNNQISISVLLDAVCGAVYPGRPLASMLFKVYGTSMVSRSLSLVADMKLGEYMKVPPRLLLIAQIWGSLIGVLINHGMLAWILNTKRSLLSGRVHDNTGGWDARNTKLFHSSAIIWNVIGAGGVFGSNSPYRPLLFVLLAGFLLPIPFYLLYRRYPNSAWRLVNLPLLALGANAVPRLPANFLVSSMVVAFVSQFVIRRLFNRAWKRYNYVIGAALDTGTQLAAIIAFTLLSSVVFPVWWGNAKPSAEHCNLALVAPNSALF